MKSRELKTHRQLKRTFSSGPARRDRQRKRAPQVQSHSHSLVCLYNTKLFLDVLGVTWIQT
jgi:hypothetical protein